MRSPYGTNHDLFMYEYAFETDENEFIFKSQFNNFVITEIVNSDLRHTPWAKMLFLDSGIPCIERHGWTSSVYITPISACSLRRYYKTSYKCIKLLIELK